MTRRERGERLLATAPLRFPAACYAMNRTIHNLISLAAMALSLCAQTLAQQTQQHATSTEPAKVALLELAAAAFERMPMDPHGKNRGRGQMEVVDACFEAGLLDLGLRIGDSILDWRRGLAHARYALACEQQGVTCDIERHLEIARREVDALRASDNEQAWRAERILAAVARVRLARGETAKFADVSQHVTAAEGSGIQADAAMRMPAEAFDRWLEQADAVLGSQAFDPIQATLQSCAELYGRFYADADKRAQLERRVVSGYDKLPLQVRLKLLVAIGRAAAEAGDAAKTLEICGHADRVLAKANWRPEDRVSALADVAVLFWRGGDARRAKEQIDAAAVLYAEHCSSILDIYRSAPLRALAEAAAATSDPSRAMEFWRRAVEAGVANPNSRPRADDFAATCVSFVRAKVAPDATLWERLQEIARGLGSPW